MYTSSLSRVSLMSRLRIANCPMRSCGVNVDSPLRGVNYVLRTPRALLAGRLDTKVATLILFQALIVAAHSSSKPLAMLRKCANSPCPYRPKPSAVLSHIDEDDRRIWPLNSKSRAAGARSVIS
jgi:hypothetical protein